MFPVTFGMWTSLPYKHTIMKRLLLLAIALCFFSAGRVLAQPFFYSEGRNFSAQVSYKQSVHNCGTFDVARVEATAYMNPTLGWEFVAGFEVGKNYFSFSPVGLIGLPGWIYHSTHGSSSDMKMIGALLSIATAKLPIGICDWLEVTPYWDLLKFTKVYDSKLKLNADVGLQLKLYPLSGTYSYFNTLFVASFIEYDFAYKKNAGQYMYDYWGYNIRRSDKSLFRGYSWGVTVGMYF